MAQPIPNSATSDYNNPLTSIESHQSERHEERELYEEISPSVDEEKEAGRESSEDVDDQDYAFRETDRHSYDYARNTHPVSVRSIPLTRHDSAKTTLSRLRSRATGGNGRPDTFTHPLMREKTTTDVIVHFDGKDDPYRPLNWEFKKKCYTTALYGATTAGITLASAIYSAGIEQISKEFHVGLEVATLGISMMLFGFGLGPLLWAPLSEVYGRKAAVLIPYFISAIFSFATGAAKDIQTIMITRFFAGFFGSAPITNTGGVLGDLWAPHQRAIATMGYALTVVGGPTLGPLIGGAICQSSLGWRWTEYVTGIYMMLILVFDVLLLDESFSPVLLTYKARRLRHETGNWALHAEHEEWDVSLRDLAHKYLVRPFQLLGTPICFLVALYASFVYGILYANLSAFPIEFQQDRGWNQVVGGLPFVAILLGILIGAVGVFMNQKYYFKRYTANNNRAVPEARLPAMMVGGIVFTSGMFIFAWTSSPSVHWIGPIIGSVLIGFGFFNIFQSSLNYLVDTFQKYGASAIAANTFLRSCLAGAFPLFINYEYEALGVAWGTTIFACFAALLIPIPFLFFIFGKRIRARGVWSKDSV